MCGIAGYYGLGDHEELLNRMNKLQNHRGPDGSGVWTNNNVGLAHTRLAIIDKAGGAQPMISGDGRYILSYNGEIYNYHDLRLELENLGHYFKTNSDTEVVVEAYGEWGVDAIDKFSGMFGLAIYDTISKKLTLARDHFGIKPLYYSEIDGGLLFSSEIKPIFESGFIDKKPNDRMIYRYLKFRIHEDSTETFFSGINKLLPGQMLEIDANGIKIFEYTSIKEEIHKLSQNPQKYDLKAVQKYRELFEESIKKHLQADVSVGTSLSGGLDSTSVALLISKLMGKERIDAVGIKQNTFSAVFKNSINDEEEYVNVAVEQCENNLDVHKIRPTADEFKKDLLDFIKTQEEPTISTGPYAQYKVMSEATKFVKVLLDGQGADEEMAGYIPYYFVYLKQLLKQKRYGLFIKELVTSSDVLLRLLRFRIFDKLTLKKKVNPTNFLDSKWAAYYKEEKFSVISDNLKERLIQDIFKNSLPSLLRYEDRNTMRFSIEGRVPFIEKNLVKFVFSLSDDAIIQNGWNKKILRDALDDLLPTKISRRRNKIGFTTPENEWFIRLKNFFLDIFLSESFISRKYFDALEVKNAFHGYISQKNNANTMDFWRIINVELWLREYFDEETKEKEIQVKEYFAPNEGKSLEIRANEKSFLRFPIRTDLVSKETNIDDFVVNHVKDFFAKVQLDKNIKDRIIGKKIYFFISEKVVAITQGRSFFIWDIKPSFWARKLSNFISKTPAGIGLGSPFTMHLAIKEVGLLRILFAMLGGSIGKLIGKKGWFYILAGHNVRAIDGPTEYSAYPANVSAKLAPKNPDEVAKNLTHKIIKEMPEEYAGNFSGVIVMDSNDIGRNSLGKWTLDNHADEYFENIYSDNPIGQGREQTPIAMVFEN